jgi:hypothetical protein
MSDGAGDEDLVELGPVDQGAADRFGRGLGQRLLGERFRLPGGGWGPASGWRPSRGACVLAAAALVVGLAAGFAAGRGGGVRPELVALQPQRIQPSAAASPSSAPAGSFSFTDQLALTQETGGCSVQIGRLLALGVEVTNRSMMPVILRSAKAVLPLGGLSPVIWHWSPCGALPQTLVAAQGDLVLLPGASTWLTMMFNVKVTCPVPYPVQFTISYLAAGRSATASLPGFPDLSQVPYTGCPGNLPGNVGVCLQQVQARAPATRPTCAQTE